MGTEVLRPQDCLSERVNPFFHRRKNGYAGGGAFYPRYHRKQVVRSDQKKRFNSETIPAAVGPRRSPSAENLRHGCGGQNWKPAGEIVMGRVTILRRGESMDSLNSKIHRDNKPSPATRDSETRPGYPETRKVDLVVSVTRKPGLEQIRVSRSSGDVYAGSGFSNSPSPRSLPLPSFFNNVNKKLDGSNTTSFDDSATRDLRRLLRLE